MKRNQIFLMLIMSLVVVGLSVEVQAAGIGYPDWGENDCNCISDDPPAIVVTASSSNTNYSSDPGNVVNGAGARKSDPSNPDEPNSCDIFSRDPNHMWISLPKEGGTVAEGDHWIRFDFDTSYNVEKILIWNYSPYDPNLFPDPEGADPERRGMKDVIVKASNVENPAEGDWTVISNTSIPLSDGLWHIDNWPLTANKTLILDGSPLRNVIILAKAFPNTNHRTFLEQLNGDNAVGLTEVRFVIPDPVVPESCAEAIGLGYSLTGDFFQDCYVDLKDLAEASANWLDCMDPEDVGCTHPWE